MKQIPETGVLLLKWAGDVLDVALRLRVPRAGRAVFRTTLGRGRIRRRELIVATESGERSSAREWHDLPMAEREPGLYTLQIPLTEVGVFEGKACFFASGSTLPEWPEGANLRIKVEPAHTACGNTVYTAFVRQFGAALVRDPRTPEIRGREEALDRLGYTVIPPSGTFRDLIGRLDEIMSDQRFRIVQLLPVHPTPVSYGRMGRYGSAFAALDFLAVDPALAQFDKRATPLDQFRELIDAVHARGGALFMDLPANHTGWAATLQTHHPEWYRRAPDGEFISPGAWGVVWADLVELDYRHPPLRAFMAEVFLFWCRQGVDGFRCDAGYMIPEDTWSYIVARVREEYPDTIFLLEGLGGKVETTEALLDAANLNWAYSEIFQTEDRGAMEWYLPRAIALAERCGPLIHFAETHDNNRLAARGATYSTMRVTLCALLSHQGAFGITNGVEWFADEKIEVHGATGLKWGAAGNQVGRLARLNTLLATHAAFGPGMRLRLVTQGAGPVLAVARECADGSQALLVLINFDCAHAHEVRWERGSFQASVVWDLVNGEAFVLQTGAGIRLEPGRVCCLTASADELAALERALEAGARREPAALARRRRNLMALRARMALRGAVDAAQLSDPDKLGAAMVADPDRFCMDDNEQLSLPRRTLWQWPQDLRRQVMVPQGHVLLARAPHPFRAELKQGERTRAVGHAVRFEQGDWGVLLEVPEAESQSEGVAFAEQVSLQVTLYAPEGVRRGVGGLLLLPAAHAARVLTSAGGVRVRSDAERLLCAVLSNGAGAMAQTRAAWGELRSQYDCLLAVNPDPRVPADKMIFWTRARAWLRYRGYSREIGAECLERFSVDPAGGSAQWSFKVPCGTGRWVALSFLLELAPGANLARLTVARQKVCVAARDAAGHGGADACLPDGDEIEVVVRPDIEWRSFHHKTKAFLGPERAWPAAAHPGADGFTFEPAADVRLQLSAQLMTSSASGAVAYHQEPAWDYMVAHAEDAGRGLDGNSDLFSPGWFGLRLKGGARAALTARRHEPGVEAAAKSLTGGTPVGDPLPLPAALAQALSLYVVRRDALKTVIAGYPWFLDWGRDTLIVLRGLIAAGSHADALEILREFGRFEDRGMLPNIIHGSTVGNWDTSDAPLWFCVAAGDLMEAIGAPRVLDAVCGKRRLGEVLISILANYRDGTPNGIRMDGASGLIYSPSHFTWMDTNYPACTPREGYPIEIQALWIASLRLAARHVDAGWMALAEQAADSLARLFRTAEGWLADCLRAASGVAAERAEPEDVLRPNQLLAVTLGVPLARETQRAIVAASERLLTPGAIRSLDDRPPRPELGLLPYHGHYAGDEDTRRKPAYHNGTAWSWPFPLYAEALLRVYGYSARATGLSLLGSAVEMMNRGALGHTPEICDGDAPHTPRGCRAQAWGVSELLRVLALFGGTEARK